MQKFRFAAFGAAGLALSASVALAGSVYTPLSFGPLTAPGNNLYYTEVYDITPDGQSYVGLVNNNTARWAHQGTTYTQGGPGGAMGLSADGQLGVGGLAGNQQVWHLSDANGSNIPSTPFVFPPGYSSSTVIYGTNHNGTAFNMVNNGQSLVIHNGQAFQPNPVFQAVDISAFAGANRGMAQFAPILVTLGHIPGVNANAFRVNYETSTIEGALYAPEGSSSTSVGGGASGSQLSGDASIVGGSAVFPGESLASQPIYWDADGTPHRVPGVGGRIFGTMNAANYTGTLLGGGLNGPGIPQSHAVLYDIASNTTMDLNVVFADQIPDGWVLTFTLHISDDGSKIFTRALAPDGSARIVMLEGEYVPTPGSIALLAVAGVAATRRRRG